MLVDACLHTATTFSDSNTAASRLIVLAEFLADPSRARAIRGTQNSLQTLFERANFSLAEEEGWSICQDEEAKSGAAAWSRRRGHTGNERRVEITKSVLLALAQSEAPMWKTDLYAEVDANLDLLRRLQDAGLIRVEQKVRYPRPARRAHLPQDARRSHIDRPAAVSSGT